MGSLAELTRALFATGVTRVVRPGEMTDSYVGAPHDGVYALQQFTRRVTLDAPESAHDAGSLSQLETAAPGAPPLVPIMTKQGFLEAAAPVGIPELIFPQRRLQRRDGIFHFYLGGTTRRCRQPSTACLQPAAPRSRTTP